MELEEESFPIRVQAHLMAK